MGIVPGIVWEYFTIFLFCEYIIIGVLAVILTIICVIRKVQEDELMSYFTTGQGTCCQSSSNDSEQEIPTSQNKPKESGQLKKEVATTMKIKIIKIPDGFAPEWVRKQWVGLKMPARPAFSNPCAFGVLGPANSDDVVLQGKAKKGVDYYLVDKDTALDALAKKSAEAANWFKQNLDKGTENFGFAKDEVRILKNRKSV